MEGTWSELVQTASGKWDLREITFSKGKYKYSAPGETPREGAVQYNARVIVLTREGTRPEILNYALSADQKTCRMGGWNLSKGKLKPPK